MFNEIKRNKKFKNLNVKNHYKEDFKFLHNAFLDFQLGISDNGIIFISKLDIWNPTTVQVKYIKWNEVKTITKKIYPGWGYSCFRIPRGHYHVPKFIGSWCLILHNGERHSLGLINKENIEIIIKYFKDQKKILNL